MHLDMRLLTATRDSIRDCSYYFDPRGKRLTGHGDARIA